MIYFLDDDSYRTKSFVSNYPSALTAENAEDIINLIQKNIEDNEKIVYLDHDLGGAIYCDPNGKNTGMEVVRWIVQNKPNIKKIIVHTMNDYAGYLMFSSLYENGYDVERIPFIYLLK